MKTQNELRVEKGAPPGPKGMSLYGIGVNGYKVFLNFRDPDTRCMYQYQFDYSPRDGRPGSYTVPPYLPLYSMATICQQHAYVCDRVLFHFNNGTKIEIPCESIPRSFFKIKDGQSRTQG